MKERTSSTIAIKRGHQTITSVPITEQCRRVFTLMSEDFIRLEFNLRSAIHIVIGDYIEDEIFGKFLVSKEQMPQYDTATGGYRYTLQFDAEYMSWRNRILMLTLDKNGVRVRKEATWRLTSDLDTQVREIIANIEILGFKGYTYSIEPSADIASEVKLMEYNGTNIIDALNQIADQWQCEWWVQDKTLHLGKCEAQGEPLQFSLATNVESMTISDNRNNFASKVYVYGSTRNLPATYRRELDLKVVDQQTKQGKRLWYVDKAITEQMFPASTSLGIPIELSKGSTTYGNILTTTYERTSLQIGLPSEYSITIQTVSFGACYVVPANYQSIEQGTSITYSRTVQVFLVDTNGIERLIGQNSIDGSTRWSASERVGIALQPIDLPVINYQMHLAIGTVQIYARHFVTARPTSSGAAYSLQGLSEFAISPLPRSVIFEPVGSSIIKLKKRGVTRVSETMTWSGGIYYRTGSIAPTLEAAPRATGYKISAKHEISNGNTYTATLAVEPGTAAVVFFNRYGDAIGWIDGKGGTAEYSWNITEHVDAAIFSLTSMEPIPGPLITEGTNILWQAFARINAIGAAFGEADSHTLSFCDEAGNVSDASIPPGIAVGDHLLVDEDSLSPRIPSAFFSTEYENPSALSAIGETRLQMPTDTEGYIMIDGASESNAVEEVVIFDDIYPRCDLVVESISEHRRTDRIEYQGEDATSDWQWIEYTIKLRQANGQPFRFSDEYMLPGAKLQIKFLTPKDISATVPETSVTGPCRLAGMTFDVEYRAGEYIIGRNEEYGAKLPNDTLRPNIGDPCILIGWNPRAMSSLGLITSAEQKLHDKGHEYAAALREGQFTFDCTMMSDFMFDQIPYLDLYEADDLRVKDSQEAYLIVKNFYDFYAIPTEGARVSITHGALSRQFTSRIIGYELKLDKPYDSPRYTVGETQAYSRLAKIEREITKVQ